jgi:hypothetical protein
MNLAGNTGMVLPMGFEAGFYQGFGSFRVPNARQFSQYVSGRFYDPTFYAPKDRAVMAVVEDCLEDPAEFAGACHDYNPGTLPYWSSYCLSPAAMFNPDVLSLDEDTGLYFRNPWSFASSFRSPSYSATRYPELKTHMVEHHWLQQSRADCNPGFSGGNYNNCEPYYFNHAFESTPVCLFYDGHIELIGCREATRADARVEAQSGHGLWSRDTPLGVDGYFSDVAYDWTTTSFHILTIDGIQGRDRLGGG